MPNPFKLWRYGLLETRGADPTGGDQTGT